MQTTKQVQQDSNQTNIFRERLKKKTVTLRFKLQTTYWNCIEYLHTRTVKSPITTYKLSSSNVSQWYEFLSES